MARSVNAGLNIVGALNDPLRLEVVRLLMAGPATVSDLVARTGAPQSKLSNHLAILRAAEMVGTERLGRHVVYALSNPQIAAVVEAIETASGHERDAARGIAPIALARTCYDHVAGRLGVALFGALVDARAIESVCERAEARKVRSALGDVQLGPRAAAVFGAHGIDLDETAAERRRFAAACNDWTEARPHLGGALGAALQRRLLRSQWLQRRGGTRALRITPAGRAGLRAAFGIDVDVLAR